MNKLPAALAGLAALCALMFGLSGCNVQFSPYAAVVNGSVIPQSQLRDALTAVVNNAGYKCSIESGGTSHLAGAGQGTYNATFAAQMLSILVQDKVVRGDVGRMRLAEPPALESAALAQLEQASTPASGCPGSGATVLAAFPAWYRKLLIRFQEDEDALSAHLAGTSLAQGALNSYVARHRNAMTQACVSVIEVGSKATALSLRSQIHGVASFASVARAHSIDTTTAAQGGVIGCVPDADFNPPLNTVLAGLKVGSVSSPVPFNSDWLLLVVSQRQKETYQQVIESLVSEELKTLNKVFPQLLKTAKVTVDPQYGTWSTTGTLARVKANAGPPADVVPNAGANTGPTAAG
ncbi:MAG: peptidylprolyl isomerase [Acidimicrobiales bacterium]